MTRLAKFAAGSVALAGILKAIDLVPPDDFWGDFVNWLVVLALNAAAATILFGIVARRSMERPSTPAVVLAVLGFLALAFYWIALPAAFVGSGAFLGLEGRERAARGSVAGRGRATAAIAIAAVTLLAAVLLSIFGE